MRLRGLMCVLLLVSVGASGSPPGRTLTLTDRPSIEQLPAPPREERRRHGVLAAAEWDVLDTSTCACTTDARVDFAGEIAYSYWATTGSSEREEVREIGIHHAYWRSFAERALRFERQAGCMSEATCRAACAYFETLRSRQHYAAIVEINRADLEAHPHRVYVASLRAASRELERRDEAAWHALLRYVEAVLSEPQPR